MLNTATPTVAVAGQMCGPGLGRACIWRLPVSAACCHCFLISNAGLYLVKQLAIILALILQLLRDILQYTVVAQIQSVVCPQALHEFHKYVCRDIYISEVGRGVGYKCFRIFLKTTTHTYLMRQQSC